MSRTMDDAPARGGASARVLSGRSRFRLRVPSSECQCTGKRNRGNSSQIEPRAEGPPPAAPDAMSAYFARMLEQYGCNVDVRASSSRALPPVQSVSSARPRAGSKSRHPPPASLARDLTIISRSFHPLARVAGHLARGRGRGQTGRPDAPAADRGGRRGGQDVRDRQEARRGRLLVRPPRARNPRPRVRRLRAEAHPDPRGGASGRDTERDRRHARAGPPEHPAAALRGDRAASKPAAGREGVRSEAREPRVPGVFRRVLLHTGPHTTASAW